MSKVEITITDLWFVITFTKIKIKRVFKTQNMEEISISCEKGNSLRP